MYLSAFPRSLTFLHYLSVLSPAFLLCSGCASVEGYAVDPEESSTRLGTYEKYFDPSLDERYFAGSDPNVRRGLRDTIVASRMRAFDLAFDGFERGLIGDSNSISAGGSVIVTALGAVGATTGGLATKSALNAASSAITGSQGIVNKELYFQKTVPALVAQMEAGRAKVKQHIIFGLKQPDSSYSLVQAYVDLEALKNAGGVPPAISAVTQTAVENAQNEAEKLQVVSNASYIFQASSSRDTLQAWLFPGGMADQAHFDALNRFKRANGVTESIGSFLVIPGREPLRQQAISQLVHPP